MFSPSAASVGDDGAGSFVGEEIPPGEAEAIEIIVRSIEERVRAAAQGVPARRDAHPKAHGCVHAELRVRDDLPPDLRVGVFATPRVFPAVIRFSNGSEQPQPDSVGDGRGMAIKLLGVEQSPSTTQDFIMINHPAFFVRNAADYVDFQTASSPWRFFVPSINLFRVRLHELLVARAITRQEVSNPLNIRYWSMTPYRFGDTACKLSARPRPPSSHFTATQGSDFLSANLTRHLAEAGASFDFLVQLRGDPEAMPIEDPTITWDEDVAPFVPVATITIPSQQIGSPEQRVSCENLSFTPWHCVSAHRPLGGINRVRRTVYETISRLRHELNGVPRQEPTDLTS